MPGAEADVQHSTFRIQRFVLLGTFGLRPKGTLSRRALPLAQALARQGHTVTLLAPPWDWPADAGRKAWIGGVEVVQVRIAGGPLAILLRLLIAIWRRRPTVVYAFKPKGYSGLALWCLWWQRRLGGWRGQLWLDADDWEAGWNERLAYRRLLAMLFAWQEPWCLTHADRVTTASRWLRAYASGLRTDAAHVIHLPNGVEDAQVNRGALAVRSGPPTLLLYTRFVEVTPARVVSIWAQVVQRAPGARLMVVGDETPGGRFPGPQAVSAAHALRTLAAAAGLQASLLVLGWTPALALPGVLAAADVAWAPFADTAVNRARCSVKLAEILAAGLPLVADDVGEAATYVASGLNGLLIQPGADELTVQALCRLLSERPYARALGQEAARRMADAFLWDRLAQRLL